MAGVRRLRRNPAAVFFNFGRGFGQKWQLPAQAPAVVFRRSQAGVHPYRLGRFKQAVK